MTAAAVVSIIVAIGSLLLSTGVSINQATTAARNQKLRSYVQALVRTLNSEISKGRMSLNKIIALLQNKSQTALMNYLQNNPVISRNLKGIEEDSAFIASLQAEQSALEQDIANLQNELAQLGYNQDMRSSASDDEKKRAKSIENELNKKSAKYQELSDKAKDYKFSTTNPIETVTSDIDARSQNIQGGLNNNV